MTKVEVWLRRPNVDSNRKLGLPLGFANFVDLNSAIPPVIIIVWFILFNNKTSRKFINVEILSRTPIAEFHKRTLQEIKTIIRRGCDQNSRFVTIL
jgi:hypothetical protein